MGLLFLPPSYSVCSLNLPCASVAGASVAGGVSRPRGGALVTVYPTHIEPQGNTSTGRLGGVSDYPRRAWYRSVS